MTKITFVRFLQYLQNELSVSKIAIEEALRSLGTDSYLLPIALWQCGVLTLAQLDQVYDWLAIAYKRQEFSELLRLESTPGN